VPVNFEGRKKGLDPMTRAEWRRKKHEVSRKRIRKGSMAGSTSPKQQPTIGRPRRYLGITLKSLARGGTRANPPRAHEEEGVEEEKNGGADRVPSRAAPIGDDVEEGIL
jgi:hypothetical protein